MKWKVWSYWEVMKQTENISIEIFYNWSNYEVIVKLVRDDSGEVPPVPMPNTEVKLTNAENTCLATGWEDK